MAGEERDARLILRAEDRASKTFDQVASSIKRVRKEIADQSKAAVEGTADLGAMQRQLEELKEAGDNLVQGQSLIRQFDGLGDRVQKAEERLKSATAALTAYQAKVGDNPTDNQSAQLEKKTAAINKAQQNLNSLNVKLGEVSERMGRVGISTDDTDREFARIAATATETAQAIAAVKTQIDGYPAAVRRAADSLEDLNAAQALAGKDTSLFKPDQFAFIQSLDGAKAKLEAVSAIERQNAIDAGQYMNTMKQQWAFRLRSLAEEERQLKAVAAASAAADADSAKRLADLNAFKQLGTDAAESAVKTERYAASIQSLGNDFQSFSQTVRAALGGTQASLQDISQAMAQIDASAELLEKPKVKMNELQASSGKLAIAIATLDRTAKQIDGLRLMQQQVAASEATFNEAQANVLRLTDAIARADAPVEGLAQELTQAQRALDNAGKAMQRDRNEAIQLAAALKRAGVDTDNLESEMARFAVTAQRAGKAADTFSQKRSGKDGAGFLGLNPFEMQNLGYQINDIFTQLGSGTPILQILAQQGPQIIQIFSGLGSTLLRMSPIIAGVLLVLSPFIGALIQASRAAEALRQANLLLAGTGEINPQAVQQYAAASVQLRNLGVDAKDTQAALQSFHTAGLDPAALSVYAEALAAAGRGGAEMAETSKLLSEAMSGGIEAVEALNDKFNILTPSEEAQVAAMIESGNESEARRIVFEKFEQTASRMADAANGPWSDSWYNLTRAFNNFTVAISQTEPFIFLKRQLGEINDALITTMDNIARFLNYVSVRGLGGTIADNIKGSFSQGAIAKAIGYKFEPGDKAKEAKAFADRGGKPLPSPVTPQNTKDTLAGGRAIRDYKDKVEDARQSVKKLTRAETERNAREDARRTAKGSPAQRKEQEDLAAQASLIKFDDDATKKAAAAQKKKDSAANKAARSAETLANQRRSIEEALARDLDGIDKKVAEGQTASIEQRRAGVLEAYTGLFQKLEEARRKGVTQVGGMSLTEYEAQARAQIGILQNSAELKGREEQINAVIKQRTDEIKNIQDQLDRGDLTPKSAMAAFAETISFLSPDIAKMADDALAFARSIRGATPDPKLEATISRLERLQQENSGGKDKVLNKELDQGIIGKGGKDLNAMLAERNELVAAQNNLVTLGVQTQAEADRNIQEAFDRTTPDIENQIALMRELLDAFILANPEMQTFYDTWKAKLDGVGASTGYVSDQYTRMKGGIQQIIASNAVTAIDNIAQSFARLALGQQSATATLLDVGKAFLGFIAQTIIGIAKLIIQMLILKAVESATGIPVGALLKFFGVVSGGTGGTGAMHQGGIAGQDRSFTRNVPLIAFANAPRYHGGGVAGFAPDEVPAILKKNEEVLTEEDPRHRNNEPGNSGQTDPSGGAAGGLRQILVLDPAELAAAMAGPAGEKVTMTHLRRNKATLKQMVG